MISRTSRLILFQPILNLQRQAHIFAQINLFQTQGDRVPFAQSRTTDSCREPKDCTDAHKLFDDPSNWDVVSATKAISRLARNHRHDEAFCIFRRMFVLGIKPTDYTFTTAIHLSTTVQDLNSGKQLHACATKVGLNCNVFVGSAILDLYVKLSTIEEAQTAFGDTHNPNVVSYTALMNGYLKREMFDDARRVFEGMPERNVVSWNAMIGGYSQNGHNEEALNLFIQMLREGLEPDQSTFPCTISAAANIAALGMGRSFHACAIKFLGSPNMYVGNSLVSFYAKCGSMEDSLLVFNKLSEKNVVSWNSLICGYAQNGRGGEALDFFEKMKGTVLQPNSVTLLGVLVACNHVGLVREGYNYFNQARLSDPRNLKPEHYACMVDLLARSGNFDEAEKFIHDLPYDPGIGFWKAMLGGCQIHSNMELGKLAARNIAALDPEDVSSFVMLSNAHSAAGRWQSVSIIRKEMRDKGLKRIPGSSWIEIKNHLKVFTTSDRRLGTEDEVYVILRLFLDQIRVSQALESREPSIQIYGQDFH